MSRIIQIEFNELSPSLLDEFIDAGELPNFKRLQSMCEVFVTDASDELTLEPWVQWPTLHTGISDRDHGIRHLGEASRLANRGVVRELADAGFRVGVFGSMNLDYGPVEGFSIPDPWNVGVAPRPDELSAFTRFVASAVQENSASTLDKRAAVSFLRYLATHGLTVTTALSVLRQLVQEKRDPGVRWRRAMALDAISYDVFRRLVLTHDVAYATFFSNSTAHFQHYFWRNFRPDDFDVSSPGEDHDSLARAVLEGYRNHDRLLGRFMSDFPDDRIVFATGLSQVPWDTTKCTYRAKNVESVLTLLGVDVGEVAIEPIMAEEFLVSFSGEVGANDGVLRIKEAQIGGQALFRVEEIDRFRFKVGCTVNDWSLDHQFVTFCNGKQVPFDELFARIHGLRSGRHHPDGCFWVQSNSPGTAEMKVPLTSVAPTLLRLFGVDAPSYMKEPAVALGEMSHG
ncbi:MAG: hypothetical protein U5O16_02020 [Rhodococcus sp. (in: high G+C Gram-positive bacteria)]|uniref:hypothetical protein n=1 Tax=Rhodococcus sp. TaxID=1831 RepID=UPI002ADC78F5|nr:hypothetical protein [Rhodococcus sp. (in: high G+C Gram-positive bacteria)]